jgi:hypothetical protein
MLIVVGTTPGLALAMTGDDPGQTKAKPRSSSAPTADSAKPDKGLKRHTSTLSISALGDLGLGGSAAVVAQAPVESKATAAPPVRAAGAPAQFHGHSRGRSMSLPVSCSGVWGLVPGISVPWAVLAPTTGAAASVSVEATQVPKGSVAKPDQACRYRNETGGTATLVLAEAGAGDRLATYVEITGDQALIQILRPGEREKLEIPADATIEFWNQEGAQSRKWVVFNRDEPVAFFELE